MWNISYKYKSMWTEQLICSHKKTLWLHVRLQCFIMYSYVYISQHLPPHNVKMFIQAVGSAQEGLSSRPLSIHLPLICKVTQMSLTQAFTELCIMTGNLLQLHMVCVW
jgi:hypothetical protein